MRKDMDKILVTRPRIGSSYKNEETRRNRRAKNEDLENLPSKSSMKPKGRAYENRKQLKEYLNPLTRFLVKNCGRPWSKVYSEICKSMDRRGVVQDHIFVHLFDYVERNPIFIDGYPHHPEYAWRIYKTGYNFYVDQHGFLREPKDPRPSRPVVENPSLKEIEDKLYIQDPKGTWFEATLKDIDIWNIWEGEQREWILELLGAWKLSTKRAELRTLSKKEKKALGL